MPLSHHPCPYLPARRACTSFTTIPQIDPARLDSLLSQGIRHFGPTYFRPSCPACNACVPIRIDLLNYTAPASHRRIIRKARQLRIVREKGEPTLEKFAIYREHKNRFENNDANDFDSFAESFFSDEPQRIEQYIFDGDRLICVSHLDCTPESLSAVYCYYLKESERFSPGRLSILLEAAWAKELGLKHLYLGYFIPENRHMAYKGDYYPTEIYDGTNWIPWRDAEGELVFPKTEIPRAVFGEEVIVGQT